MGLLTIELVNEILEGLDSDRSVSVSEDGKWVLVTTSAFYDQDDEEGIDPNREQEGDVVAQFRIYAHEHGLHQALHNALVALTAFYPLTKFVEQELQTGPDHFIGFAHWPGAIFKDEFLAKHGWEIDEYPWVKRIDVEAA
jgi:hypothetical protein